MTSETIKNTPNLEAYATEGQILGRAALWLQEIAYQLARMNEREMASKFEEID